MKTQFGYFDKDFKLINTISVDVNQINSSDPLAFAYGVHHGQMFARDKARTIKHGSKHTELAQEYLRGFLLGYCGFLVKEGTKIRKGYEQCYALFDKRIDPNTLNKT